MLKDESIFLTIVLKTFDPKKTIYFKHLYVRLYEIWVHVDIRYVRKTVSKMRKQMVISLVIHLPHQIRYWIFWDTWTVIGYINLNDPRNSCTNFTRQSECVQLTLHHVNPANHVKLIFRIKRNLIICRMRTCWS